jgi:hypothetical protein
MGQLVDRLTPTPLFEGLMAAHALAGAMTEGGVLPPCEGVLHK